MDSKRVHLVQLEVIETRYTKQWKKHLPLVLMANGFEVVEYYGETLDDNASSGAFLNWSSTNYFKSSQGMKIAEAFHNGEVKPDDIFLFADFWDPVVMQVKYMSVMMDIPVKIVGITHAGSYDKWDWIGRKTKDDTYWVKQAEAGMVACYDALYFATHFHNEIFQEIKRYGGLSAEVVGGFPMEYIPGIADPNAKKRNLVLFTQRNAPEKQPELFDELAAHFVDTEYEFINVQRLGVDKNTYHALLNDAKLVVSFAKQETLGITPYEALVCGCDILVPDRLSYKEMYSPTFKYPEWMEYDTETLAYVVNGRLKSFDEMSLTIKDEARRVGEKYFSSEKLIRLLRTI